MVCNTGVSLTPSIDGKLYHFESRGLYDGVSLLRDDETGSFWHHITGDCLYGPLVGERLGQPSNLLHMSAGQALNAYSDIEVAISERPLRRRRSRWAPLAEMVPGLSRRFRSTMAGEDTRRPTMDVGLGVWTEGARRYYPMEYVSAGDRYIIDRLDGRGLLIYFEPAANALTALYTGASGAVWEDGALQLDSGEVIRGGVLYGPDGARKKVERPLQLFTRWYGFALTFPDTEISEPRASGATVDGRR